MKNKPVAFYKRIHSCCATVSSEDILLNFRVDKQKLDFDLIEARRIKSSLAPLNGQFIEEICENYFLIEVFLTADKTFYNTGSMRSVSEKEVQRIANPLIELGWQKGRDYYSQKYSSQKEYLEAQLRYFQGYVIPEWNKDLPVEAYRGALSDEVFNNKGLQDYLSKGGCFGYIGHSQRTYDTDREIETIRLEKSIDPKYIAVFMSHTAGRHFADDLRSREDVRKNFGSYFDRVYDDCIRGLTS